MMSRDFFLLCLHCVGTMDISHWWGTGIREFPASSSSCKPAALTGLRPHGAGEGAGGWSRKGGGTHVTSVPQADVPNGSVCFRELFLVYSLWKRTGLIAMTHSFFRRLLLQSCFFQLQSQVILNNSPAALAHSNVIRALTSLTILLHIAFQMVNAFLLSGPPLPTAPGLKSFMAAHGFITMPLWQWLHLYSPSVLPLTKGILEDLHKSNSPDILNLWFCWVFGLWWRRCCAVGLDFAQAVYMAGTGPHSSHIRQLTMGWVQSRDHN